MVNKDYAKLNELKGKLLLIQNEKSLFEGVSEEHKVEALNIEAITIQKELDRLLRKKFTAKPNLNRYKKNQYYRKYKPLKNCKNPHSIFSKAIADNGKQRVIQMGERAGSKKWLKNRSNRVIRRSSIIEDNISLNTKLNISCDVFFDKEISEPVNKVKAEPFKMVGNSIYKIFPYWNTLY